MGTRTIETIYFGGGTPSLLSEKELQTIMAALATHFTWDKNAEFTLECNPDDLSEKTLTILKNAGVNRLSVGLQSFNPEELKWMNRAHTAEESLSCIKRAQDFGFQNISIDLIYGSKFQHLNAWEKTLKTVVGLNIQHISAYNLTIEPKTVLGSHYAKGKEPFVDEQLSSLQFEYMMNYLSTQQFIHYEISNFGKGEYFSKHNSSYWRDFPYLGIGPSAHSYNRQNRQWNVSNNSQYIKAISSKKTHWEMEALTTDQRYNEYVLTRLRTIWGCDTLEISQKYGQQYTSHFLKHIQPFEEYLFKQEQVYCLNTSGKLIADKIAMELFV
jgi:oxygen-independent coproporphyrinogen III oxidase